MKHRACLALAAVAATPALAQNLVDITPVGLNATTAADLSVDPRDPNHLVVISSSIFESFDAGESWQELNQFPQYSRAAIDANGALLVARVGAPTSDPTALQRRTPTGLENVPAPAFVGISIDEWITDLVCHPTRPDEFALDLFGSTPNDDFVERIFATTDGAATWENISSLSSNGYTFLTNRIDRYHLAAGGSKLSYSEIFQDLENHRETVYTWDSSTLASRTEYSCPNFSDCTLATPRHRPDVTLLSVTYLPFTPSGAILRREGDGPLEEVGDPGVYARVATGHVDPDLALALTQSSPTASLRITRDGGATWTTLVDFTSPTLSGFRAQVELTRNDEFVYVLAPDTAAPGRHSLLRVSLETQLGPDECPGVPNSTGRAAELTAVGRQDAASNRLLLSIRDLPPGLCFLPLVSRDPGFTPNPGGSDGNLCLSGTIGRALDATGMATNWGDGWTELDLTGLPQGSTGQAALAGDTWRLQVWYRDCSALGASNLTNAVSVTFE